MLHQYHISEFHPIMIELINLIQDLPSWYQRFNEAMVSVLKYDLDEFSTIHNLKDWLIWANNLLYWIPRETPDSENVDHKLLLFYFLLNQPSLMPLQQEPILSKWMVDYARAIGTFLDTTESLTPETLKTFYEAPLYRMGEYMPNPSGWKTFNQFFARHVKPGYRPIDSPWKNHIIVSAADSVYEGCWPITANSEINVKGLTWSIAELLQNNPYSHHFKNGLFMHSYLSPTDYHRLHTPLPGRVLYSEIVPGNVYLETHVINRRLKTRRSNYMIASDDSVGYQFSQARGILILDTPLGLVAVLPIGMSFVSSVVMTADVGIYLQKGQEFGYFQFGGSDYIMLFPEHMNITFTAQLGIHYDQGQQIAYISV